MKRKGMLIGAGITASLAAIFGLAISGAQNQDKYTLQVPGGLAFSEFKGYENWEVISASQHGETIAVIVGNPEIIKAFKSGIPGNGKPFPGGAKMAKVHWNAKVMQGVPGSPLMPVSQHDVDFMVKDSKRFPDGHGWGYGEFELDPASNTFRPGNTSDKPPQEHDAKCGVECHDDAQSRDYVFTQLQPK
jgi:hypothetical protein